MNIATGTLGRVFFFDKVLGLGQHAAAAAGRIIDGEGKRQLILDRVKHQVGHQLDHLTRGEVFPGLFVILFVEFADQLFEHIAHAEVGQRRQFVALRIFTVFGCQVDIGGDKFLDHIQQYLFVGHMADLRLEIKAADDLFDVIAEAIEVFIEVFQQDLLVISGRVGQGFECPFGYVVEDVTGCGLKRLFVQLDGIHLLLLEIDFVQYRLFGGFKQGVQAAQHHHWQDHITILTAHIDIAQAVIGNTPDKRNQFVVYAVIHLVVLSFRARPVKIKI